MSSRSCSGRYVLSLVGLISVVFFILEMLKFVVALNGDLFGSGYCLGLRCGGVAHVLGLYR